MAPARRAARGAPATPKVRTAVVLPTRGPAGAGAAYGPHGATAYRGPYGGAVATGPYGGTAYRAPYPGGAVYRPWVAAPYYGAVVAGVTVGTIIAATTPPPPPSPALCWFWSSPAHVQGYGTTVPASVVVPKSAILWIISGADFGTINHTRKQCFASVLIDSEVRKAADPGTANFQIGTLERFPFALAHRTRSSSLFESVIHRSGDPTCADHVLGKESLTAGYSSGPA